MQPKKLKNQRGESGSWENRSRLHEEVAVALRPGGDRFHQPQNLSASRLPLLAKHRDHDPASACEQGAKLRKVD